MKRMGKLAILGAGVTGQACANYALNQGWQVVLFDAKRLWQPEPCADGYQSFVVEDLDRSLLEGVDEVVVSPGFSCFHPWLQALEGWGIPILSDIDFFARFTSIPIIGVTGTNGKSTVSKLLHHAANALGVRAYAGGNLGPPAITLLQHQDAELYILELSSAMLALSRRYQLEVGLILNIGSDHMDWHQDLNHYQQSKCSLCDHAKVAIVPEAWQSKIQHKSVTSYAPFLEQAQSCLSASDALIPAENIAACMAVGAALGWSDAIWPEVIDTFECLPHRLQYVPSASDKHWYNDSKGTNFEASAFACKTLWAKNPEPICWLAGGLFKTLDLTVMAPFLEECIAMVVVFGQKREAMYEALRRQFPDLKVWVVQSMEEAILLAEQQAKAGMRILCSPGGSSFDAYANYQERGEVFMHAVKSLGDV